MQKHLLFGLFLLLTLSASAQITRGDVLVMMNGGYGLPPAAGLGSLGGTQSEVENFLSYSSYHLNVGGTFGYALRDRLVVGAGVGIGLSYGNPAPSGGSSFYYAYTLSPLVRYYVVNREKLGVFAQAVTGASIGKGGFHGFGSLELTAGLQLPLSEGVLLTPTVGYDGQNPVNVGARLELRLRPGGTNDQENHPQEGQDQGQQQAQIGAEGQQGGAARFPVDEAQPFPVQRYGDARGLRIGWCGGGRGRLRTGVACAGEALRPRERTFLTERAAPMPTLTIGQQSGRSRGDADTTLTALRRLRCGWRRGRIR